MLDFPLHHIGVATHNIEKEFRVFQNLGYSKCSDVFIDPVQKIKGLFIVAPGQPTLELLENLEETGPLGSCLKNGIKFYHFAYLVDDIEHVSNDLIASESAKMIIPITAASYFSKICFFMFPNMLLVEFVQSRV